MGPRTVLDGWRKYRPCWDSRSGHGLSSICHSFCIFAIVRKTRKTSSLCMAAWCIFQPTNSRIGSKSAFHLTVTFFSELYFLICSCVIEWSRCCALHFTVTLGQNFIAWYHYMMLESGRRGTKSLSLENSLCKSPRTYRKTDQATNESLRELWVIGGLLYAFSICWHKYVCYVIIWTPCRRIADILFKVKLFVARFIGIMSNSGMPNWQMTKCPKDYRWMGEY